MVLTRRLLALPLVKSGTYLNSLIRTSTRLFATELISSTHLEWLEELRWRGLVAQHSNFPLPSPREGNRFYFGIDPTAKSLHLGNLVGLMVCQHLLRAGFSGIVVLGGATARVGDPSFRDQAKTLLDPDAIQHNLNCLRSQIRRIFGIKSKLYILDNQEWYQEMGLIRFMEEFGSSLRLNVLLGRESVQRRLSSIGGGMSFAEFSYPLLQAYDFVHLYRTLQCRLQVGGSDQWGNMITGLELLGKIEPNHNAGIFTFPLLTTATDENPLSEEKKMGKSEGNAVWLSAHLTSPFELYQYILRLSDETVLNWLPKLTLLSQVQVQGLINEHRVTPERRIVHQVLAKEIITFVHDEKMARDAAIATDLLYHHDDSIFKDYGRWKVIVDALCYSGSLISLPTTFDNTIGMALRTAFPNASNSKISTII